MKCVRKESLMFEKTTNKAQDSCGPKVQILMATYNGAQFLRAQLDSILSQTYMNWQLRIRDDASKDDTPQIIREYAKKDSRITYTLGKNNVGVAKNFSELLDESFPTGSYVMLADQDDVWLHDKIEATLSNMLIMEERTNGPILVYCNREIVDERLHGIGVAKLPPNDSTEIILGQNHIFGCTMMLNYELMRACLPFPSFVHSHDYWIALVSSVEGTICRIEEPYMLYRVHQANVTGGANNYSLTRKLCSWKKVNRAMRLDIQQNYKACKLLADRSVNKAVLSYSNTLEAAPIFRLLSAKKMKLKRDTMSATARLYFNMIVTCVDKDS